MAVRAHEQLAILVLVAEDADPEIRAAANDTVNRISTSAVAACLGHPEVPAGVREFFGNRGVIPTEPPTWNLDEPLVQTASHRDGDGATAEAGSKDDDRESVTQQIARMTFTERMLAALKGSREMRALLIRDPNRAIAASVLSSPKVNDAEVESFAKMTTVSEDILRMIGSNRAWVKNYGVVLGLTRNPKTPLALSLNLMNRLNDRDMQLLSNDRNVPEPLRVAARRRVVDASSRR
jgi:hypothetical protein